MVKLYGSVSGQSKEIKVLYGSVNGHSRKIQKLYGSVNGVSKLIYEAAYRPKAFVLDQSSLDLDYLT